MAAQIANQQESGIDTNHYIHKGWGALAGLLARFDRFD